MTIFKSSFPDVELPEQTINDFLASRRSQFKFNLAEQPAITSHETGKTLTYDELFKQIDKCAVGLHKMGLKQNEVVAVLLPNCIEYAISFLAVSELKENCNFSKGSQSWCNCNHCHNYKYSL